MRTVIFALSLLCLASPRPARACSCGMSGPNVIAPEDGATDVPQDALLWIGAGGYAGGESTWWQVVDAVTGAPRGGAFRPIEDEYVQSLAFAFEPPLVEGERVQLRKGDGTIVSTFTVGARRTSEAPGRAYVNRAGYRASWAEEGSSCDEVTRLASVEVGPGGVLAVLDTSGTATAGDGPVAAGVAALGTSWNASIGMGDCYYGWAAAAPGAELSVRGGLFSLNGRFSGWSEPVTLRFPGEAAFGDGEDAGAEAREEEDGGCSAAPGRAGGAWVVLVFAVLLGLRGGRRDRVRGPSSDR